MIAEEDFAIASDDGPEMAFVRLERKFRTAYEAKRPRLDHFRPEGRILASPPVSRTEGRTLASSPVSRTGPEPQREPRGSNAHSGDGEDPHLFEYMNHTMAAAAALGLDILSKFDPSDLLDTTDRDQWAQKKYKAFREAVDRFAVQVQIAHVRSGPRNSVGLDPSEKTHLRAYADKIKDIIDKSSLRPAKKERLFDKINAFIAELDKDRTLLQRFNDVVLSLAHTGGEAAEELEPVWKWVKLGAAILGVRQETEQTKLPAPPKKLEPPKHRLAPPRKEG